MTFTRPRGTNDILPDDMVYWHHIEDMSKQVFDVYRFNEIRTPVFESTHLFTHGIGNETDIVAKEMYSFTDKGGRSLTLRPEGTASVVRAYIQNKLATTNLPSKLYYNGPMFRYERPQAGRFRQFYQIGAEYFGVSDPYADAEMIAMSYQLFKSLGIQNLYVLINSIGCKTSRPVIEEMIRQFISQNLTKLPEHLQKTYITKPLRLLDNKDPVIQAYFSGMPSIIDALSQTSKEHFYSVIDYLDMLNIPYTVKPTLVRGLDYYNDTVFEIVSSDLGAQDSVCGGGRYNHLVHHLGGKQVPAFGFAFGVERTVSLLKLMDIKHPSALPVYLIPLGDTQRNQCFKLLHRFRHAGIRADMGYTNQLKSQLKKADQLGVCFALIYGDSESENDVIILRDMSTGDQQKIPFQHIFEVVQASTASLSDV